MKVPHCAYCGKIVQLKAGGYHAWDGPEAGIVHHACLEPYYAKEKLTSQPIEQLELFIDKAHLPHRR